MASVSKAQTMKNLSANIVYFVANILIGVFLVPFYIDTLGIAAYGIIPLATSLIGYVGVLTDSLNSAMSRHLTVDVQSGDAGRANRTFNSALFGMTRAILLMVPAIIIVAIIAPMVFGVAQEHILDATWLFLSIGAAFLLRSWSSSFTVTLYASNRLDLINLINSINVIVQVALIIGLFSMTTPSLALIGIAYLLGAIVAMIVTLVLFRRMNVGITVRPDQYDGRRFREMAEMGGWIIVNNLGSLLFLSVDLLIVNYLFGNVAGGEYAIALQWTILLRAMATTFISVLGPVILIAYANKQMEDIITYSKSAVKLTGIGMALPVGLICGFAPNILGLWVGDEFAFLAPLLIILISHLVINTAVTPLFLVYTAFNKVRAPAIITLMGGIGNVLLVFLLAATLGWGIYGVAAAGLIGLTIKNFFFTPIYAAMVMQIPLRTFYPSMLPGVLSMSIITMLSIAMSSLISPHNLVELGASAGAITAGYVFLTWKFLLDDAEKSLVPIPASIRRVLT